MNIETIIKNIVIIYTSKNGKLPDKKFLKNEIIRYYSGKKLLSYSLELKNKNINLNKMDILFIVKNGENYLNNYFPKIYNNLKNSILNLRFYIYENNSQDNTKKLLNKYSNFNIICENLKVTENFQNNIQNYIKTKKFKRFSNILEARNKLVNFYKNNLLNLKNKINLDNNWILLQDIDIIYNYNTILELSKAIKEKPDGIMFCANTSYVYDNKNLEERYYDIMALNYGKFFNSKNGIHDYLGIKNLFSKSKILKLETGFGGLALIRKDVFLSNIWSYNIPKESKKYSCYQQDYLCEHWDYCKNIRKFGEIYIVKDAKALWIEDNIYEKKNYISLINKFVNYLKINT